MIRLRFPHRHRPGMTLLITVLIAGAVALSIGLTVAMRAIGELDIGLAGAQSDEAQAAAEACMDETLIRLQRDASFAGAALTVGRASCSAVVAQNAAIRTIDATAVLGRWTRKIRAAAALTATGVTIKDWRLME